jgi:hypothetical protein
VTISRRHFIILSTHLDDISPDNLSLSPLPLNGLPRSPPTQKPMPDLVIIRENLLHLEPTHVSPQKCRHGRDIRVRHFAPSGSLWAGWESVLSDETGDGFAAADGGEADIDEFGGVEVSVVVSARGCQRSR